MGHGRGEVRQSNRQEGEAGFDGAVAGDGLQPLGGEEPERCHRAEEEQAGGVGAGALTVGEEAQRHDGLRRVALVDDEQREQDSTGRDRGRVGGFAPSGVGGADDAEHQCCHAKRGGRGANGVGLAAPGLGLGQEAWGGEHHRQADREVDEEPDAP
jgi:hypothetical protein